MLKSLESSDRTTPAQIRSIYTNQKDIIASVSPSISSQQDHHAQDSNQGRNHGHTTRLVRSACELLERCRCRRCHRVRWRSRTSSRSSDQSRCRLVRRQCCHCPIARNLRHGCVLNTCHEARTRRRARRKRCRDIRRVHRTRRCCRRRLSGHHFQGRRDVVCAHERRDVLVYQTRFRLQEASDDGLQRRRDGRHP